ncbi:YnfA family protein [Acetobacter sicerae]|uniref:YnfA family protein n=1 Tax=Acetobacter sicerae TaxID=85325 RepID=A0ABS8VV71_9PROT|nr:YnfA family protein [Acetobacter sicerae]MCE0742940.1 YnfA family protein [Acetobacter sicerae]
MSLIIYTLAAFVEIAGCFSFWAWLREGRSPFWLFPGCASLVAFAWLLTLINTNAAGRSYAAYGGIYLAVALFWLWSVEGVQPDRADYIGVALCLAGTAVILLSPHNT